MPAQNVKAIVKRFFTEFPEDNSKWKCRCGKILTQKPNTGWSNLFQHIKSQHSDYLQDAQSTLQRFHRLAVHSPVFESAVCKLQNGQQSDLTEGEKGEIYLFIQSVSQPEDVRIVIEEEDFASSIIKKRRQECDAKSPDRMYIDTRFLLPTSNILERFFSTTDITYSDF